MFLSFHVRFIYSFKYGDEAGAKDEALQEFEIINWPPVLHIHLKRFTYDAATNSSKKNNKRFEFYPQLDFSQYNGDAVYTLHSVLGEFKFTHDFPDVFFGVIFLPFNQKTFKIEQFIQDRYILDIT